MSTSENPQNLGMVQNLHRQAIDAHTEGQYAKMESLLGEALKNLRGSTDSDSLRRENLPFIVKESFWLAQAQQMQGNYSDALRTYEQLIDMAPKLDTKNPLIDEKSLWCIVGAFMYYVECGGKLSPSMTVEARQDRLAKGLGWLLNIGKVEEWSAGLRLQQGLLFKEQNELDRAREELRQALKLILDHPYAPGYTLATYRLELAELLCTADTSEGYKEAADLARQVLLTEGNNAHDRWQAYKTLAYARLEQGKITAQGSSAYLMETGFNVYQLLVPLQQEIEQVSKVVTDLSQSISTIPIGVTSQAKQFDNAIESFEKLIEHVDILIKNQAKQLGRIQTLSNVTQADTQTREEKANTPAAEEKQCNQTRHIMCLVAMPFKDSQRFAYETVLLPSLRTVLEQEPYYWQVIRTDENYIEETVERNVVEWMKRAHAFVADISDLNPDVMMELGYMRWGKKHGQPLLLLERAGTNPSFSDLAGFFRISYPDAHGDHAVEEIVNALRTGFAKHFAVRKLNSTKSAHYLSPLLLFNTFEVKENIAEVLSHVYITVEDFVNAPVEDVTRYAPAYTSKMAGALQEVVAEHFGISGSA